MNAKEPFQNNSPEILHELKINPETVLNDHIFDEMKASFQSHLLKVFFFLPVT